MSISRHGGVLGAGALYMVYILMMAMILAGIMGSIVAYFGTGYDFRKTESEVLLQSVQRCFAEHNFFDKGFKENVSLFFNACSLSPEVLEDGNHFVFVNTTEGSEFFVGVYDYKTRCYLDARKNNIAFPQCSSFCTDEFCFLTGSSQNSRRAAV